MANQDNSPSFPADFSSAPRCSICLDPVVDNHGRSIAKLQCRHFFHLDCIGSEFNAKGAMQCPNCRETEDGQWLFAGGLELSENNEETEEDVAPLNAAAPIGYQVCTYNELGESSLTSRETRAMPNGSQSNIHVHQQSWITQGPFPYRGPIPNASNQGVSGPLLGSGSFDPTQVRRIPVQPVYFRPVMFNRSASHQGGSVVYLGNNDRRQVGNQVSHRRPSYNSSPPAVLAMPAPRRHRNSTGVINSVRDRASSSNQDSNNGEDHDSLTELTLYTEPLREARRESNDDTQQQDHMTMTENVIPEAEVNNSDNPNS